MMPGLVVSVAATDERAIVENLAQFYIHDFSELFAGTPRADLADDGRYAHDIPISDWWQRPDHVPLLFRLDGKLAGFALLNASTHSGAAVDRNMAEFFVARKYRRMGLGRAAAHTLFSRYPGRWEAAVMRANNGARTFWESTIRSHPGLVRLDIADSTHFSWNGTFLRFDIASP